MADDTSWWQGDAAAPTGPDLLKTLDPGTAGQVKAMAEGRQALPSGISMKSPVGQRLLSLTAQYDPTFDSANLPARIATRKAFTSGKQGQGIISYNTALSHLGVLAQRAEELNNGSFPLLNGVANAAESATGDPRVTNFGIAKQAVVDELTRAFRGSAGNVSDIKEWETNISAAKSPAQLRGAIQQAAQLLGSRIQASKDSYNQGMGTTDQPLPMLNAHAEQALAAFNSKDYLDKGYQAVAANGGTDGNNGAPPSAPPAGPAGGTPAGPTPSGGAPEGFTPEDIARGYRINADGSTDVAGPDGRAYVRSGPHSEDVPDASTTDANGALGRLDTFAANAANALTFGTLPKIGAAIGATEGRLEGDNRGWSDIYNDKLHTNEATLDASNTAHPIAALGGNVAGFVGGDGVLGAIPGVAKLAGKLPAVIRPALGDAIYGGAYGAGSADSLGGASRAALTGAGLGAAGGALGRGFVRGVGSVLSPVANAAVRRLTDAGVTLTPGQIAGASGGIVGRSIKGVEDRLAGFPVVGDIINNARRGGVEDFNRAAINDAVKPIGESVSGVGHEGIAEAQQKVSDAYTRALGNMTAVPDAQFTADLRTVGQQVQSLSEAKRGEFHNIVDTDLQPYLAGKAQIGGDDLQAIKQGLDTRIANLRGQGSTPQDRDLADSLEGVRDSVLNLARRTDPASAADFDKANASYAALSRVNNAAAKAKDGVFTPQQFRTAVGKRGYGTTTNNLARGSALSQQLSTDASTILPSNVPDAGTAGRLAVAALGGGVGGREGYREGGVTGALTGAALGAAAFSRPGLKATQYVLAGSRGKPLNTLGDLLRRNAALGGAIGAPLLLERGSK